MTICVAHSSCCPCTLACGCQTSISELAKAHGIEALVTGDILDVCERFMERAVEGTGVALIRPLWGRPRLELLQAMEDRGLDMVRTALRVSS